MSAPWQILALYPNATFGSVAGGNDVVLLDLGDGAGPLVRYWPTAILGPQPTEQTFLAITPANADATYQASLLVLQRAPAQALLLATSGQAALFRAILVALAGFINNITSQIIAVQQATWNPGNLANGSGVTSPAVTINGAQLGDFVQATAGVDIQGLMVEVWVSAANTVKIRLENRTGAAINLGSQTWNAVVWRPTVLAQINESNAKAAVNQVLNNGGADS